MPRVPDEVRARDRGAGEDRLGGLGINQLEAIAALLVSTGRPPPRSACGEIRGSKENKALLKGVSAGTLDRLLTPTGREMRPEAARSPILEHCFGIRSRSGP